MEAADLPTEREKWKEGEKENGGRVTEVGEGEREVTWREI